MTRNLRDGPYPMRRWHGLNEPSDDEKLRAAEMYAIHVSAMLGMKLDRLGPGVIGYTTHQRETTFYPWIQSAQRECGHVSRWLDSLPRDERIGFVEVINAKLRGMLARRGFVVQMETMDSGEVVEAWIRDA